MTHFLTHTTSWLLQNHLFTVCCLDKPSVKLSPLLCSSKQISITEQLLSSCALYALLLVVTTYKRCPHLAALVVNNTQLADNPSLLLSTIGQSSEIWPKPEDCTATDLPSLTYPIWAPKQLHGLSLFVLVWVFCFSNIPIYICVSYIAKFIPFSQPTLLVKPINPICPLKVHHLL